MVLICATCARLLGGDREDESTGDAGRPTCGECNRARNFDAIEEVMLFDELNDDDDQEIEDGDHEADDDL